jgi:5'-nucleotidase
MQPAGLKMRRLLVLGALLPAAFGATPDGQPGLPAHGSGIVTVQVLAINDFHGNLEPPSGTNGLINGTAAGGAEYLATHLRDAAARNPHSIIVAAGDLVGASPLISALFHNEPAIESMNAINLAVASVGNHEFDRGPGELLRLQRGGCHPADGCLDGGGFHGARFRYLSANVIDNATHAPLLPATAIQAVGGVRIGFIGETLRGTKRIVAPGGTAGLTFLDEASTANLHAARLRGQGVHAIVLLIHEGGRQGPDDEDADPNGCADFSGAIAAIVRKLTPDIKVVISGHSHRFYNCTIAGHVVTSASSYGRMVTRIQLEIESSNDTVSRVAVTNEVVSRDVEKDATQARIIAKYRELSKGVANRRIGSVTGDIMRQANVAGESALGDVIADAQLTSTAPTSHGGAVVAFMNAGGIRADLVANSQGPAARPGDVTYGELFNVQPFGNVMTVLSMTGEMIKRLLEEQFDNPIPGERSVLQVSRGFTYRYSQNAPAGQRVDPTSLMIGGRPVAPKDRLRVAASDFLVAGGNNFTVFKEGTHKVAGDADIDALVAYVKTHSPVVPGPQNRIVRTD